MSFFGVRQPILVGRSRILVLFSLLISFLLLVGCGGDDEGMTLLGPPSPPPPDTAVIDYTWPVDYSTAFRFLQQSTFGPVQADLEKVMDGGIAPWLDEQLEMFSAYESDDDNHLTHLERLIDIAEKLEPHHEWRTSSEEVSYFNGSVSGFSDVYQMSVWFENALNGPDQLRQRVAYALSQILVVSASDPQLERNPEALAHYYDILARNALGNFRTLLDEVARSPAMGIYLSHQGNEKTSDDGTTLPDENFARELMQLFTIGLYELNLDGTPKLDGDGHLIPTYNQTDIEQMAKVMTGWDLQYNAGYGHTAGSYVHFMEFTPQYHERGDKMVMGRVLADDGMGGDLHAALKMLFDHPNTAPFICKQLIQRLVTSNPTPEYIERVARVFLDNGRGIPGDLGAVVRAILLDPEARTGSVTHQNWFGKANEHLLVYTSFYRAFNPQPIDGWHINTEAGREPVDGIYYFNIHHLLGQGPLRAHHVFNFYDPDFVPQDAFYRESDPQRVLPEMQLRSANNIANIFEVGRLGRSVIERNSIFQEYGSENEAPLIAYVQERNGLGPEGYGNWNGTRALALLDYTPALQAFELGMEGDSNGDYSRINDAGQNGDAPKLRGLDALLDFLESRMLGGKVLDAAFRDQVIAHLNDDPYFNTSSDAKEKEAIRVTAGAIQYVLMSSVNMAQQ